MKGCIINNELSISNIFNYIEDIAKYNWLITNIECYPSDEEIARKLADEYCWIEGKDLFQLLNKEDFQWIWGVFSAFPKNIELKEILKHNSPYADGYKGFWTNPITLQHPLAVTEITAWDGLTILVITKNNEIVNTLIEKHAFAQDLENYTI